MQIYREYLMSFDIMQACSDHNIILFKDFNKDSNESAQI